MALGALPPVFSTLSNWILDDQKSGKNKYTYRGSSGSSLRVEMGKRGKIDKVVFVDGAGSERICRLSEGQQGLRDSFVRVTLPDQSELLVHLGLIERRTQISLGNEENCRAGSSPGQVYGFKPEKMPPLPLLVQPESPLVVRTTTSRLPKIFDEAFAAAQKQGGQKDRVVILLNRLAQVFESFDDRLKHTVLDDIQKGIKNGFFVGDNRAPGIGLEFFFK